MTKDNEKYTENIIAIARAAKVLDTLFESEVPLGVSSLAEEVTTFRILNTLTASGMLKKDKEDLYSLSPKFILYGDKVKSTLSLKNIAEPVLEKLAEAVGENANLGVAYKGYVLTLAHVSASSYLLISTLSPLSELYCSSMGKIILSHMDDNQTKKYFSRPLKKLTINTITDYPSFQAARAIYLKNSIMYDDEEFEYGLYCLSAPIYDCQEQLIAVLGVSGPKTRMLSKYEQITAHLLDAAHEISDILKQSRYTVEDFHRQLL